jgi:hypothetical protein
MAYFSLTILHQAIAAVCPIDGVAIVNPNDNTTWRIDYGPSATPAQQQAAQQALAAITPASLAAADATVAAAAAAIPNPLAAATAQAVSSLPSPVAVKGATVA